jgi:hypothetical protein
VFKWLNVAYRVTGDTYFDRRNLKLEIGSARAPLGQTIIDNFFRSEFNGDLLITAKQENLFFEDFDGPAWAAWLPKAPCSTLPCTASAKRRSATHCRPSGSPKCPSAR